ncbi:MAG: Ig-like domain-containing protein [Lachnospiraceae bacterium]|nr:Ig-like domain-containing protein [Lachnospiraceae bacterium]
MVNLKKALAVVMAAATAFTFAPVAQIGSTQAQAEETKDQTKVTYKAGDTEYEAQSDAALGKGKSNTTLALDTVSNKTAQISVANTSAAIYYNAPTDTTVLSVSATGTVTALKKGSSSVRVTVGQANYTIPFLVDDVATDRVSVNVNGKAVTSDGVSLDLSTSTASNAIKSLKLNGVSSNGLTVKYDLYDTQAKAEAGTQGTAILRNTDSTLTVGTDGTLTAGSVKGDRYIRVYTDSDNAKGVKGSYAVVKVTVNQLPEAIISSTQDPIVLDVKKNKTVDLSKVISVNNNATITYTPTTTSSTESDGIFTVDQAKKTLTAVKVGEGTLRVSVPVTTTTRATTKDIHVSVLSEVPEPTKVVPTITVDPYTRVTVGSTVKVNASTTATGAAIAFTSDNPAVATVDANGNVSGVSAGVTTITVTSPATAEAQAASTKVTVIVDAKSTALTKVTGVKVTGRKKNSTKITVKWTAQPVDGIYYRVEKTIVKKVNGKTVKTKAYKYVKNGKTSTTLKISKTDTVKVRVRAIVDNADGNQVAASWSKATTSKRPNK